MFYLFEGVFMQMLMSITRAAIDRYSMIEEGDKIAVGISGGKDSISLLYVLAQMRKFYPKKYDLSAITIDPQFNGTQGDFSEIQKLCDDLNVPYVIKRTDIWQIIFKIRKESNPCSLCSRMRGGSLHDIAKQLGCNKVALGHHLDDSIETFYMNLFNCGTVSCFAPLTYLSRKDIHLIRPFCCCEENKISNFAKKLNIPVVKSSCPEDGYTERENIKNLIKSLEKQYPDIKDKTLRAMQREHISNW